MNPLDDLRVGSRIRIPEPRYYDDEDFAGWRTISWLPPRQSWGERITVAVDGGDAAHLWLDHPERIEVAR